MDWTGVSMGAIVHACNQQVGRANAADWPTDLSAVNLSKYLKTVPEEDRWWTHPPLSTSAVPPAAVEPAVESADDGTHIHHFIMSLQSNCAQLRWRIPSPSKETPPLPLNYQPKCPPGRFPCVRPVLAKIRGRHVLFPRPLRWPRQLLFPRPLRTRDVVTPLPICLRWRRRSARRRPPPRLPLRQLVHLRCPSPFQLWRSAPCLPLARALHPLPARCASSFRRLRAWCVMLTICCSERPHPSALQERCDPCIAKDLPVCWAQDKPTTTLACESCANSKKQCKKPAYWAMNITDLSMLHV